MPQRNNFLLKRLEPKLLSRITPHLSVVELHYAQVLAETDRRIDSVYFPHSGVISCIVDLKGGDAIETGMIGKDGAFGAGQALDGRISMNRAIVQAAGVVSVISTDHIVNVADEFPAFKKLLLDYEHFLLSQVQQTAACNAAHNIQARTCKWLLRMHELAGPDLLLTQELLAQMMGVRRTSVTEVAVELQKQGLITYNRGHIRIDDLGKMQSRACECDEDIRSHYRRIMKTS
jgi:CRP-like cAMP-binding protein